MSFYVSVKPSVLLWARESIGLSAKDVADKTKASETTINNWEDGREKPTFAQIEKLAALYKRPLAAFLLSEPPQEPPRPKDFRTELSMKHKPLSPKTLLAIRKARRLQASAIELNKELDYPLKPLSIRATLNDDPEMLAENVRGKFILNEFNVSLNENRDDTFEGWKKLLEDNGVLVFQISIQQREIKGLSLIEGEIPAIVVNKADEANSKIFSLFHELAHILLNETSGICDMIEDAHSPKIEQFCNRFAGAFLVPASELLNQTLVQQNKDFNAWENRTLNSLADKFGVSKEVILRRLLILGRTSSLFYNNWREKNVKEYRPFGKGGKNPIKICVQERGKKYITMVLAAYNQDKISTLDVADYMGVKIDQIPKVRELISK